MFIPKFNYHRPITLTEACEMKGELKDKAVFLAGGTDVIVNLKKGVIATNNIISLNGIPEIAYNSIDNKKGQMIIGACSKISNLINEKILFPYRALTSAMENIGSPIIRNLATIGGNIITARPSADSSPPLIAYNAKAVLNSVSGKREVSLDDFFLGPGKTILNDDELLTAIILNRLPPYTGSAYIKLGVRKALEISLANVAAIISLEKLDGPIANARIVMGAVGPIPLRATTAEKSLIGEKPCEDLFTNAAEIASNEDCSPIDDFRGSAEYRRDMIKVLTERALQKAVNDIRQMN